MTATRWGFLSLPSSCLGAQGLRGSCLAHSPKRSFEDRRSPSGSLGTRGGQQRLERLQRDPERFFRESLCDGRAYASAPTAPQRDPSGRVALACRATGCSKQRRLAQSGGPAPPTTGPNQPTRRRRPADPIGPIGPIDSASVPAAATSRWHVGTGIHKPAACRYREGRGRQAPRDDIMTASRGRVKPTAPLRPAVGGAVKCGDGITASHPSAAVGRPAAPTASCGFPRLPSVRPAPRASRRQQTTRPRP